MGTTFHCENESSENSRTDSAQFSAVSPRKVKFPHIVRFRTLTAMIYGKTANYPFYQLAVKVAGKRLVRSFQKFTEAKSEAENKLRDLSKGNQSAGLNAKESADALAVREAVQVFYRDTGRKVSALQAVNGYLAALRVLPVDVSPEEACRKFCQTIAAVERKPLATAVTEFCDACKPKAVSIDGKRSALNPVYVADTARMLNEFSTPAGQVSFIAAIARMMESVTNQLCAGVFYWGAEYQPGGGGNDYNNSSFWDYGGNLLPVTDAVGGLHAPLVISPSLTELNLQLEWPFSGAASQLMTSTNLGSSQVWSPVTNSVSITGTVFTVTLPLNNSDFYHLQ